MARRTDERNRAHRRRKASSDRAGRLDADAMLAGGVMYTEKLAARNAWELIETSHGFRWGPMEIQRVFSTWDGGCILLIRGERQEIEVRVTPSGFVRVGELKNRRHS